jgi:predicted RNA-binding Zn-ribbon protein involved in translation (DUF1610 family)
MVSFTRKKDKRKGWYTYFWTLDIERTLELLNKRLSREIEQSKHQLESRKTKRFFTCKTCNIEVSEEKALLHDFTCPECGEVYELSEKEQIIEDLKKKIIRLERQRKDVLEELGKIKEKKRKRIVRAERREKKKKAEKRRKAMKKRLREKKRLKKLEEKKKKPKKKIKKKKPVKKRVKKKPKKKAKKKKKRK